MTVPHDWQDVAAIKLYEDAGGPTLVGAHARLSRALASQARKLEEFSNTPFTESHAKVMETSTRALVVLSDELDKWHQRIYPYLPRR